MGEVLRAGQGEGMLQAPREGPEEAQEVPVGVCGYHAQDAPG